MADPGGVKGHVIVCGLGHVGFRIVELLARLGERFAVVAGETRSEWIEALRGWGALIVTGDARDTRRLAEAGLAEARALVAATNHDVVNVEIALDARAQRPDLALVARL